MNRNSLHGLVVALAGSEPRASLERLLRHAVAETAARGGAVLTGDDESPVVVASVSVATSLIRLAEEAWADGRRRLQSGNTVPLGDGAVLHPLAEGREWRGGLLLVGGRRIPERGYLLGLATVLDMLDHPAVGRESARERMVAILERYQWNLARVARHYQISRKTLYERMARLGIERRKVPRSLAADTLRAMRIRHARREAIE